MHCRVESTGGEVVGAWHEGLEKSTKWGVETGYKCWRKSVRVRKSTAGAIFIMRQLQEKYLEKAFDKIPRTAIRWAPQAECTRKAHQLSYGTV